jgi:pilus assembly protein Flp/PilA
MVRITNLVRKLSFWKNNCGQDLIEYALMAGFIAVAAGALTPAIANGICTIFSMVVTTMASAASQS